jgi:hypothetical protein
MMEMTSNQAMNEATKMIRLLDMPDLKLVLRILIFEMLKMNYPMQNIDWRSIVTTNAIQALNDSIQRTRDSLA